MASKSVAIDCKFGTSKPGDEIILPCPMYLAPEVIGILSTAVVNEKCIFHNYDLYIRGAYIGKVQAKLEDGKTTWRVLE